MDKQIIENYRIISTIQLVGAIKEGINSAERFCFILGSGASVSSGIPMGGELERKWMAEMEERPGLAEVHATAEKLRENERLEYDFNVIEEAWQKAKKWECRFQVNIILIYINFVSFPTIEMDIIILRK